MCIRDRYRIMWLKKHKPSIYKKVFKWLPITCLLYTSWSWIEVENRDELFKLIINEGFTPVSYTHLDVYKRQIE